MKMNCFKYYHNEERPKQYFTAYILVVEHFINDWVLSAIARRDEIEIAAIPTFSGLVCVHATSSLRSGVSYDRVKIFNDLKIPCHATYFNNLILCNVGQRFSKL